MGAPLSGCGGMVDTQVLGTCALQRESSSLSSRTIYVNAGLLTVTDTTGVMSTTAVRFDSLIDTKVMGSSSMVEHLFLVQKVVGSSPTFPAKAFYLWLTIGGATYILQYCGNSLQRGVEVQILYGS